jgi:hypothetical protein
MHPKKALKSIPFDAEWPVWCVRGGHFVGAGLKML